MATNLPDPKDSERPDDGRLSLDERIGRYVLSQPLVRSARERPDIAVPWIVLGLAVALAGLIGGMPAVLLVLLIGLPILFGARLLAPKRRVRTSGRGSPIRLLLLVVWVVVVLGLMFIVAMVDAAAGNTGIVRLIGWAVVLLISGKTLQWLMRS
jgi:hypothetical protein